MAKVVPFPGAPRLSERALAEEFANHAAMTTRYVSDWNRWMIFDGAVWVRDETLKVPSDVSALCEEVSHSASAREAMRLCSARTTMAVLSMAKHDQRLAAVVDQWDDNPMVINCEGVVYDLAIDAYERPAIPGDYFTKTASVRPGGDCPLWMEFLALVCANDAAMMDYLQRVAGYCLTGSVEEQCLFFLYGPGGNGKSTFINTISGVMGDYAKTASIDTFTATRNEQHPTDLADLMGARLVTAMETANRKYWNETRIKMLTGGDMVKARFMKQDFFEYRPQFKLVISGNSKPQLNHVDDAMRRRVQILPFIVKIEEAQRVKAYEVVLRAEWPGILAWMIEGSTHWRRNGLLPPPIVLNATSEYLGDEDTIGTWLEDCTMLDPEAFESRQQAFTNWTSWCKRTGEFIGTRKNFVQLLRGRPGFKEHKRDGVRGWVGIRLNYQQDTIL